MTVGAIKARERGQAADRLRRDAPHLGTDPDRTARREIVEQFGKNLRCQVLVVVVVDLHHRRIATGAQALDLGPREQAVGRHMTLLADALAADRLEVFGAAQHAGRRAAELNVVTADRRQIEHCVEGRNFQHADIWHFEHRGNRLDRRPGEPVTALLLCAPQQREDRRRLPAGWIFRELLLRPRLILRRELEACRLFVGETADGHRSEGPHRRVDLDHRSTSPNTISIDPRMALTSASICLRHRKSIAWRCAKPGARSFTRYGLLEPSDTR